MATQPIRRPIGPFARRLVLWGCLAALVASPLWPPSAAAADPTLTVEPGGGPCDGTFVVRGRGFSPGEEVVLYLRPTSQPPTAPPMGYVVTADAQGNFAEAVRPGFVSCLPSTAPGGEQRHEVRAVGQRGSSATASLVATPSPRRCFAETGFCVAGRFLQYWEQHGGLARHGYPLSDVFVQRLEDGREYAVQYFERVRLEAHAEHAPPHDVLLGQFGRRIRPADPPAPRVPGATYFPETGHNLGGRFRAYWERNGGLDQFGYPLSEEFEERLEDGQAYRVQYFERARLEYHPEHGGTPYEVLLGQFGRRILAETR